MGAQSDLRRLSRYFCWLHTGTRGCPLEIPSASSFSFWHRHTLLVELLAIFFVRGNGHDLLLPSSAQSHRNPSNRENHSRAGPSFPISFFLVAGMHVESYLIQFSCALGRT